MAKVKYYYQCNVCGAATSKWVGQCAECQSWNTFQEVLQEKHSANANRFRQHLSVKSKVVSLADIEHEETIKTQTGIKEWDRVLGGGLVKGSVTLIGGDPGIGKSTILLQMLASLQIRASMQSLYVTGEESAEQVGLRGKRLGIPLDGLRILTENHLEKIVEAITREKPSLVIIDSIQTIYSDLLQSAPGAVAQVRECAAQLVRLAKQTDIAMVLVGHVTKEGALAGPRVLEHMVDTVLYFEGDSSSRFRVVRAIKNRFGAVNELGLFAMTDKGLKEVNNPSAMFLSRHEEDISGSIVMVTREGTRPLLVEVQALVDQSSLANPRRVVLGLEQNRLSMLLAVMHRHLGAVTHNQDVYVNVVGGVKISETAADIAILMAILSSLKDKPLDRHLLAFGEVGLSGEIRPVQNGIERLKEAEKHGFTDAIIPVSNAPSQSIGQLQTHTIKQLSEILQFF